MPRNGSGGYSLPEAPFQPVTPILSSAVNSDFTDIATALTGSVAADGQTVISGALKGFAGSEALPGYAFSNDADTGVWRSGANTLAFSTGATKRGEFSATGLNVIGQVSVGGTLLIGLPIGGWISYGGTSAPALFIFGYGQAISRTTYADLFTAYGTTFGSGDGSTTFNVPDLRGRADYGRDDMGGSAANRITSPISGLSGITLGAGGGSQGTAIVQGYLPAASLSTSIPGGQGGHAHPVQIWAGAPGLSFFEGGNGGSGPGALNTDGVTLPAMGGTTALGGSGVTYPTLSPGIITNKIIFAGV